MTTEKYQDADGNPILLETLCRQEPEWAANCIRTHRDRAEQLAGTLREVEWTPMGNDRFRPLICPRCRNPSPNHHPDCRLAAALAAEDEKATGSNIPLPDHPIELGLTRSLNGPTPPVVEKKQDGWYYHDEQWSAHGPYDSEKDAREACSLYASCYLEGDLSHTTEEAWKARIAAESLDAAHPCTDWRAWACECVGACSCHGVGAETERESEPLFPENDRDTIGAQRKENSND